ncbi:hypothetical protein AV530_014915 [Patagioenas fasciata monilis]|uniref:Uncharacterized protein n=1 Tax=Patagioenas fasciata monilis TaxID=372326 RepID=A0A1V4K1X4_PATFA|nr:hypothetical protein AV530_014915 [Patagioenas fasciata monilis]
MAAGGWRRQKTKLSTWLMKTGECLEICYQQTGNPYEPKLMPQPPFIIRTSLYRHMDNMGYFLGAQVLGSYPWRLGSFQLESGVIPVFQLLEKERWCFPESLQSQRNRLGSTLLACKVNDCQRGGKQRYALLGGLPPRASSQQPADGGTQGPVLQDGLMETFLQTGGGSSCTGPGDCSISEYLWCEGMVGQQNSRGSQLSPVDDKLSLSI